MSDAMDKTTPFRKLLVANRGEIAVRVMRTARKMGFATVAVHSTADAEAVHVTFADEAVCIGGDAPAESYLRIDAIIEAARRTGADAIHPGYGFLSENADMAAACAAAGIVFVGPSADAIRAMGDKAGAKALMQAAGVPCVPGYQGEDQSDATLAGEAAKIGYPVMIKATAGGGGRGMRLVADAADFPDALQSAKSEARTAFGDDRVLLEKAITNPRHVEIQIMADRYGNAVHFGERDCSVQRRHQKVIEEAPSPAVGADLRARMGAVSVQAALAIGYHGAGTFEYLLDDSGAFYFMEMNTRLQVEHPVTEMITGTDLVELQLQVASGAALPLTQDDISFQGHAIEVRLCAEDPAAGFLPQSGQLAIWAPDDGLRVDHGLRSGGAVPPFYDSMLAKLIAHGATREAARRKLMAGLGASQVMGLRTNRDFLIRCLGQADFAAGAATTGFIEQVREDVLSLESDVEAHAAMIAAGLLCAGSSGLVHGFRTPLRLLRDDREYAPSVTVDRTGLCRVDLEGQDSVALRVTSRSGTGFTFDIAGVSETATLLHRQGEIWLALGERQFDFRDLTFAPKSQADAGSDGKVRASMNGNVVSVDVSVGDRVEAGQKLVVLEAMKMEHVHASPVAGTVEAVHVTPGAQVTAHALMVEVVPD